MDPDEIKAFVEVNFPEIKVTRRHRPDGWSFWYGKVRRGSNPTRIARAVEIRHGGPAEVKPAASLRIADPLLHSLALHTVSCYNIPDQTQCPRLTVDQARHPAVAPHPGWLSARDVSCFPSCSLPGLAKAAS